MIHIAKSLAIKLLLLLMLLIVLSAFLIGSMRLLTPAASYFRGELEQWVSEWIERPVRIGGFTARWRGLGPELVLSSVEVDSPDATHSTLRLAEMRLSLAILESLRNLEIKTRQVTLSRVKLLVTRHANGTFTVGGLDSLAKGSDDSSGLFAIPSRIRLEQSEIAFENQLVDATEPLLFHNVNALLRNAGKRHQLDAQLPFPGGGYLELRADIQGDFARTNGWQADLYLKGDDIALASLLQARIAEGYSVNSGRLNLEFWGHWEDGQFRRTQGQSDIVKLSLRREATAESSEQDLDIGRLGGSFLWTAQAEGWQLDVRNLKFIGNGAAWRESGLSLSTRFDNEGKLRLLAGAEFAQAGDLSAVFQFFLAQDPEIAEALETSAIQGELQDLRFEFEEQKSGSRWSLQGRVESLVTQPWTQIPGVRNLDAAFWLNSDGGSLLLEGKSTVLNFPKLFRDPLELKILQGQVSWSKDIAGGWRLESPDILAVTKDIYTNTRLTLEIPAASDKSAFMDLQTDFSDGQAINAHRYYPVGIMPEAVVSWLDRGIVDGKVISGSALVRGPLNDFPFHKTHNGVFEVFFHTEKMTIDYAPGWPRLTDVAAEVRFLQNGFEVKVERGMIFDSQLNETHGGIADFLVSPFELKGSVQGALHNNLRLLRESPLAEEFAVYTESMSAAGEAVTKIDLTIPISADQQFSVDGTIDFAGSSLNLQEWQLPLTDIQGDLYFSQRTIRARGLKAKVLGSDITVDIDTLSKPRSLTRIEARTQISSRQLARRFAEIDFGPVSGGSEWSLRLDIPHRSSAAPSLLLSSNLRGVGVELPAPFGKAAAQQRSFTIGMEFPENGSRLISFHYGSLANLVLSSDAGGSQKFTRGALQLGGDAAKIPGEEGFALGGRLKSVDLQAWSDVLQSQAGDDSALQLSRLELSVEQISAGDFRLDDVAIDFRREREFLNGTLSSRQAEGSMQIPTDILRQPLRVRLERLSLNHDPNQLDRLPGSRSISSADPTRLPTIDLEVEKTEINGKDFGKLQLNLQRIPTGLALQTLSLESSQLQLSASGEWTKVNPGEQHSRLQLSLTTGSLGDLLDDLGYARYIDQAPGVFEAQVEWRDSPLGFRPGIVNGEIDLQFGKGQFLNVDPGLGRVFGLLNIAALQRRLSLDFSDLLSKGLAFDSVEGSFALDKGDAYTTDFQIRGPSAQVDISGRTGLASEDFDQLVTVTPHLSAALPVAGFLAGGPVGGAAMLLAQGLLGNEVDKASKRQYEVKGPWSDPVFTPLAYGNTATDSAAEDRIVRQRGSADAVEPVENDKETPGLFTVLKKQFTPTKQKYRVTRDGGAPGTNP